MAQKTLDAYKLGVVLDASGATKGVAALQQADKAATRLDGSLSKLSKGFKVGLADAFEKELKAAEKMAAGGRVSALGNQLGSMVGQGLQNGIGSVFTASNLGKLIGTAIAPGVGTVVGSVIGSAVDTALDKISGPLQTHIQRGIELNKQLEIAKLHFTSFTGSEKEATAHLDELRRFAKDAGLDLPQLLTADQRLEEFNDDLKLSTLELRAAADQSAKFFGSQSGFDNIANALGLIAEKGELSSKTLTKLQKSGIPVVRYLSEATGFSEAKVKNLIAKNRFRGDLAAKAIAAGIEVHAGGYAERVANTTGAGREARNQAILSDLDMRATNNVTGAVGEMYSLTNWMLSSGAADKFVAFIDHAAGSLINLTEKVVKTGVDVTGGIFKGMLDPASLIAGASNYVGEFINALRSPAAFNSHSPAQAMIPIGEDAGRGVLVGFEGYMANEGGRRLSASVNGLVAQTRNEVRMRNLFAREPDFLPKLKAMAAARGINPDHLLNVMALETAGTFNPAITNPFGYTGLIQFGKSAARDLGTSTAALRGMSATAQLDYVFRYLDQHAHDSAGRRVALDTQAKLYAAVGAGHAERDDSSVFFRRGSAGFANNPAWNVNGDGLIQQWELGAAALSKLGAGVRFTVNDQPLSGANPMPVVMVGDLQGGVGELIAQPKPLGYKVREQAAYSASLDATASALHEATQYSDGLAQRLPILSQHTANYDLALQPVSLILPSLTQATQTYADILGMTQKEFGKASQRGADMLSQLAGALGSVAGLIPGQQVGRKRGFFSKVLGIAAPFLSFIPGVGPMLSHLATIGSNALAGNWQGVVSGFAEGLQPGGFLRGKGSSPGASLGDTSTTHLDDPGHRATGGPVRRGRAYIVGEYRNEVFEPNEDGYIHPSVDAYLRSAHFGRHGDSGIGAVLTRLEQHFARLSSVPMDHVFTYGASRNPGAVFNAFVTHVSRDASAIEFMNRRIAA